MHGGIGMTDEFDIGFFMKRARVLQELFGDASFHMDRAAPFAATEDEPHAAQLHASRLAGTSNCTSCCKRPSSDISSRLVPPARGQAMSASSSQSMRNAP